jgi:hypothetical protein
MKIFLTILIPFFAISLQAQTTYHWRQISGPLQTVISKPDSANTQVTGLSKVGIYGFQFSVTNAFGTSYDTCSITVVSGDLSVKQDSVYHFHKPQIKKLDIKMIARSNDIYIQIQSPQFQTITCTLYDFMGRKLAKVDMQVSKGTNFISIPKPKIAGLYLVGFQTYFDILTQKILL